MYQQNNVERLFDITMKKALPYLILSPPEFRDKLVERMDPFFILFKAGTAVLPPS